jgi:N-methylhydantoinase A
VAKLNIDEVIVPVAAGVGSAVGFLQAPVAYEVVRSRYALLDETFDATGLNALYAEMRTEAEQIVAEAAPDADLIEIRTADMRYHGQGPEIAVELPTGPYDVSLRDDLTGLFETAYTATYSRRIPGLEVEVMNWTLRLSATVDDPAPCPPMPDATTPEPLGMRDLFDPDTGILSTAPVYRRDALTPGAEIAGPAVIAEDETTTIVLAGFTARLNAVGYIMMQWKGS